MKDKPVLGAIIRHEEAQGKKFVVVWAECDCICHKPFEVGGSTMHFMPCCDNGLSEKRIEIGGKIGDDYLHPYTPTKP